ncbi:MAG: hypothetical protein K0R22_960 [Sporomusa sp.]|nr:hypothetical protein [Sporomusa sp.]
MANKDKKNKQEANIDTAKNTNNSDQKKNMPCKNSLPT